MPDRPLTLTLLAGGLALAVLWTHHEQSEAVDKHVARVESETAQREVMQMVTSLQGEVGQLTSIAQSMKMLGGPFSERPEDVDALWVVSLPDRGKPEVHVQRGNLEMPTDLPIVDGAKLAGLWRTKSGDPLLLSLLPLELSDTGGQPRTLVLARLLGSEWATAFARDTGLDCRLWDLGAQAILPPDADQTLPLLSHESHIVRRDASGTLVAYQAFGDVAGRPQLLLSARSTMNLEKLAQPVLDHSLYWSIGLGTLAWVLCAVLLSRKWHGPGAHATSSQTSDSRELGGVLHNMGNVLNSVNISASVVSKQVDDLSLGDLGGIAGALEEHKDDLAAFVAQDTRGQHLRPLLNALSVQLGDERRGLAAEVQILSEGIEHICDLIRCQQGRADLIDRSEEVQLGDRLEEALRITNHGLGTDANLEVVREFDDADSIETDKNNLIEILVNLVQNARQSMSLNPSRLNRLTLRVHRTSPARVLIEVEDTGGGITPECMGKVFDLGFTTKEDGHGYGLHTAAIAAREMGGALWASSAGKGLGATFTLELPTNPAVSQIARRENVA
ncbi:MAG: HAMP domain-containing sensor histidine kinase [Planctomycetota bacterium]|nr:HAMP domain-containing sensor histidine kinase [Planctomycetota bacterium]